MDSIELTPFQHKVGGNSYMFRYDDETVSKPFVDREYFFYNNAPKSLLPFLPTFKGIADVRFEEEAANGILRFHAYNRRLSLLLEEIPRSPSPLSGRGTNESTTNGQRNIKASTPDPLLRMSQEIINSCDLVVSKVSCQNRIPSHYNNDTLRQLKEVFDANAKHGYKVVLLQNIISRHSSPCVMDIKVGTRLHNDDMPEEKKQLSIWRCSVSTTKDLALRIGGLKVYSAENDCYIVMDKYAGRNLNIDGFCKAVQLFFNTEKKARTKIIDQIIEKLDTLKTAVSLSQHTRLYACSILLIYEGDPNVGENELRTDVKIIDFENATTSARDYSTPTDGCLLGIRNLIEILNKLK